LRGKMGYMAPEQCALGPVDHRTDVFAAGAILYRLVTGAEPYPREEQFLDLLRRMREARFPLPRLVRPDVPPALEQIICRAMARDPSARFPSARAMQLALEGFVESAGLHPKARELGEVVNALFPQRAQSMGKAQEAGDVQSLVEQAGTQDLPQPGERPTADLREVRTAPATPRQDALPTRSPRRWLGFAALAVVIAGAAAALVSRGPAVGAAQRAPAPPPAALPQPPAAPAPAPTLEEVSPPARSAASPARPSAAPRRNGRLVLDSYPWVTVHEGARQLGVTPLQVELPAGRHRLLLDNPQLKVHKSVWVEIKEAQESSVYERLGP
jgi:hypothetical protein